MDETPAGITMQEYRGHYRKTHDEFFRKRSRADVEEILDVVVVPPSVDMTEIKGSDKQVAAAIDRFYANDGRSVSEKILYLMFY